MNFSTKERCQAVHTQSGISNMKGCLEENGSWAPYFGAEQQCKTAMNLINSQLSGDKKYTKCQRYVGGEGWTPTREEPLTEDFIRDVLTSLGGLD